MVSISKEKKSALEFVDENKPWLSDFHKEIWGYSEPAFREYKSVKAYVKLLRARTRTCAPPWTVGGFMRYSWTGS